MQIVLKFYLIWQVEMCMRNAMISFSSRRTSYQWRS
jgi:hypothetical protein